MSYFGYIKYTKESLLAHKWSHAFGYTNDHAYHISGCQSLAKSDPDNGGQVNHSCHITLLFINAHCTLTIAFGTY